MGTPLFAVASLAALLDAGCNVVAVITAPDRPAGRGMRLQPSEVKQFAAERNIRVLQPTNLKSPDFLEELLQLKATVQVVVAFRMLPEVVWAMPPKGTFNLHASLLPQYRGAAPINHAIINGETQTGVTTFFLQQQIDTGNVILQERTHIGADETAGELENRIQAFPQQDTDKLREAPKIFKDTCRIDWNKESHTLFNLIRGLSPYPTAFTRIERNGEEFSLKVFKAELTDGPDADAGSLRSDGKGFLHIRCSDGWLSLLDVQLSGKRRVAIADFLRGFDLTHARIQQE